LYYFFIFHWFLLLYRFLIFLHHWLLFLNRLNSFCFKRCYRLLIILWFLFCSVLMLNFLFLWCNDSSWLFLWILNLYLLNRFLLLSIYSDTCWFCSLIKSCWCSSWLSILMNNFLWMLKVNTLFELGKILTQPLSIKELLIKVYSLIIKYCIEISIKYWLLSFIINEFYNINMFKFKI
jgi:hypothetical protein